MERTKKISHFSDVSSWFTMAQPMVFAKAVFWEIAMAGTVVQYLQVYDTAMRISLHAISFLSLCPLLVVQAFGCAFAYICIIILLVDTQDNIKYNTNCCCSTNIEPGIMRISLIHTIQVVHMHPVYTLYKCISYCKYNYNTHNANHTGSNTAAGQVL